MPQPKAQGKFFSRVEKSCKTIDRCSSKHKIYPMRASWWKKIFRIVGGLLLLFSMVLILEPVFEIVKNLGQLPHLLYSLAHFLVTHIGQIVLMFFASALGTIVIIAAYEGLYRANPEPLKMRDEDLAEYVAQQKKQQNSALTKTILFVFVVVFVLYCLSQTSQSLPPD